jgi:uncharacterized protein (DUF2141 family)
MRKLILIVVFIFSGLFSTNGQENETYTLTVNVSGLESNKGKVLIALFNEKKQFLKNRFKEGMTIINNKKITYVFEGIPKGEYAVSIFHDENDNDKMDTNFFGIPKEDYGCSNNARGFMGPPKYEDAKFHFTAHKTIQIEL